MKAKLYEHYPPDKYATKTMEDPDDLSGMSTLGVACTPQEWQSCVSTVSKFWQAGY
eukprot:SAG11_NODE_18235_length_496_cov_1.559194_1_plen_55_part_10